MQNNLFQAISMISQSQNPMALLNQFLANNPHYQQVLQIAQNKSPEELKQYATNLCKTQGIDINSLAKQFNLPLK